MASEKPKLTRTQPDSRSVSRMANEAPVKTITPSVEAGAFRYSIIPSKSAGRKTNRSQDDPSTAESLSEKDGEDSRSDVTSLVARFNSIHRNPFAFFSQDAMISRAEETQEIDLIKLRLDKYGKTIDPVKLESALIYECKSSDKSSTAQEIQETSANHTDSSAKTPNKKIQKRSN